MEKRPASAEGRPAMCKAGDGDGVTYAAFLDALLTNVCCGDMGTSDSDNSKDFVVYGSEGSGSSSPLSNDRVGEDGDKSPTKSDDNVTAIDKKPLAEPILPRLRFNPLISTSASPLDEFFELFLKDDAPHSFLSFHKSKGDEEIKATPWKMGQQEDKLERTITFITKFTPKNLQEPQDKESAKPFSITDINNAALTLAVTSHQTLRRQPTAMILESRLSFSFVDYSLHKTSLSKMLNLSLTQFLISNDVKGSEVNVRVVLTEGDGEITSTAVPAAASGEQSVIHPFLLPDRFPSLSEHPPPENILEHENHDGNKSISVDVMSENPCNVISPTHIGASLLSAIRARNCPTSPNSATKRNSSPVDEAALLIAKHSESVTTSPKRHDSAPLLQRDIADDSYDVLRTASSRGSLKFKHVSSFEASVNPGEMSMRRILWEKDRSGSARNESDVLRRDNSNISEGEPSISSLLQPFDLSSRGGLSMHIEMEVRDSSSNNTTLRRSASFTNRTRSNGNSSLQRTRSTGIGSPSLTYIEEKVRKGLKKRVARSWITWANAWCCRLWEDEQMERFLRKGNPAPLVRKKSNTRPTVRRIGERKKKSKSKSPARKQTAPNNDEMDKLAVMQKQIHTAESVKQKRVVTPTSSPNRDMPVWVPLQVKDGNQMYSWMSSEGEEGQCGVEVCTITPDDKSKRSKETDRNRSSLTKKKFIRGMKQLQS